MTDIPEDVMKDAEDLADTWANDKDRLGMLETIAHAIMAERERCAKVAARHKSRTDVNGHLWHEGQDWAADRIEAAIREGAEP